MSASRNRMILGVVAGVAALAAFWFLVLAPKQQEASALRESIDSTQAEVAKLQAETSQLQAAKGSHDVDYASVVRLGKAVPTDDDVGSLIVQLDSAAKRSGVDFRSVQLSGGAGTTTPPPATAGAGDGPGHDLLPPGRPSARPASRPCRSPSSSQASSSPSRTSSPASSAWCASTASGSTSRAAC